MDSELLKSLHTRYAVKKFDPSKKLSDETVDELLEVARLTATSYGLQLMKIVLIEDDKLRNSLLESSYGQRQVVEASHLIVLCREKELDVNHIQDYIRNISKTRSVDENSLQGFKSAMSVSLLSKQKNDLEIWMDKQVYIALGNLLTACAILNIGSCPMEGFVANEYDEILGLEKHGLVSVLALPLGYAATDDPNASNKKVRRSEKEFIVKL
jgi:nitroreductase